MDVLLQIALNIIWRAAKQYILTGDAGEPGWWNPFDSILFRYLGWNPKEVKKLVHEAADELRACEHCGLPFDDKTSKVIVTKGRLHHKISTKLAKAPYSPPSMERQGASKGKNTSYTTTFGKQ